MCTQVSRTIGFLVRDKYTRPNPGYRFSKRSEIGSEEEENGRTQQEQRLRRKRNPGGGELNQRREGQVK